MTIDAATFWARLQADPRHHDFYATLRRIDALHADRPRLGRARKAGHEALRLGQEPALEFAVAALSALERDAAALPRLRVHLFGLLGPNGPMPLHLTETTRNRLRHHDDPALLRFLDLFHHRLLSLFFRAWADQQPAVQHDRPHDDRYATWLGACAGLASAPVHGRRAGAVPAAAALHQAGLLGSRSRHAEGLAKLLAGRYGVPVHVEQHVAQWLRLEAEDRTALGRPGRAALGRTATAGDKRLDRQYRFRLVLGPLDRAAHTRLLPGGLAWRELCQWVRHYAGLDLRWDVQLLLRHDARPAPRLGQGVQLGVETWIGRRTGRGDLRLRPESCFLNRRYALAQRLAPGAT